MANEDNGAKIVASTFIVGVESSQGAVGSSQGAAPFDRRDVIAIAIGLKLMGVDSEC